MLSSKIDAETMSPVSLKNSQNCSQLALYTKMRLSRGLAAKFLTP